MDHYKEVSNIHNNNTYHIFFFVDVGFFFSFLHSLLHRSGGAIEREKKGRVLLKYLDLSEMCRKQLVSNLRNSAAANSEQVLAVT